MTPEHSLVPKKRKMLEMTNIPKMLLRSLGFPPVSEETLLNILPLLLLLLPVMDVISMMNTRVSSCTSLGTCTGAERAGSPSGHPTAHHRPRWGRQGCPGLAAAQEGATGMNYPKEKALLPHSHGDCHEHKNLSLCSSALSHSSPWSPWTTAGRQKYFWVKRKPRR